MSLAGDLSGDTTQSALPSRTRAAARSERIRPLSPGDRVERYEILELIGSGGMGAVYAARDPELDRRVAIKVLYLVDNRSERRTKQLLREGRALARLTHPNVVTVFDVGQHDGSVFIAMELIEGTTLREWLTPLIPWRRRVEVFVEAGRGLAAVHECGLLHLDFKPSNVMVDADGRVLLADFGLAAGDLDAEPHESAVDSGVGPTAVDVTRIRGTPDYMAPEQQIGTVTAASDQFAFCVALYEALTGRHPFGVATTSLQRLCSIATELPTPLDLPDLPPKVGDAILRGLARRPEDRWPSVNELLDQLEAAKRPRRTSRWIAVGGAMVLGLGALAWVTEHNQGEDCPTAEAKHAEVLSAGVLDELGERVATFETEHGRLPAELGTTLEQRVGEWSRAWATACEAVRSAEDETKPEAYRVLDCLGAQQVSLEGTVDLLLEAEAATLVRGLGIVRGLERPSRCTDGRSQVSLPDSHQRDAVAKVRAALARAKLQGRAGRPKQALATAEVALEEAEALAYQPLTVDALVVCGGLYVELKLASKADGVLERAAWLALEVGDTQAAVSAFIGLVDAGRPVDRIDETLAWAERARAILEEEPDPHAEADLEAAVSYAMWTVGRAPEAVEHAERAVRLSADLPEARRDVYEHTLTVALVGVGRYEEAEKVILGVIDHRQERFGPLHPITARSLLVLATIQKRLDRTAEAVELYHRVLDSRLLSHGRNSRMTAAVYNNRGDAYIKLERYDDAVTDFEQAAAIWNRSGNFDSAVYAYLGLAETTYRSDHIEAMKANASHAWELIEATPSGRHSLRWKVARLLALAAEAEADESGAHRWWREALDSQPPTDIERAEVHAGLARTTQDPTVLAQHRRLAEQAIEAADLELPRVQAQAEEIRRSLRAE